MFGLGLRLGVYSSQLAKIIKSGLLSLLSPSTVSVSPGAIADTSVATTAGSAGMALDDINNTATVVDGSNSLVYGYNINSDGTFQLAGSISTNGLYPGRISISPNGNNAYISTTSGAAGVECYSRNTGNGTVSLLGIILGYHANTQIVVISPNNDFMYISDAGTGYIYTYSGIDTNATLINSLSVGSGTTDITISPDGLSVYTINYSGNTVSEYSRSTSTGLLTSIGTIATGSGASSITISPDGLFVYVTNSGGNGNTVSEYSRSTSTGLLTSIGTFTFSTLHGSGSKIFIRNNGLFAYIAKLVGVDLYSRNKYTGLLSNISGKNTSVPLNTNISPDGLFAYTVDNNNGSIAQYSISNGLLNALSPSTISSGGNAPTSIIITKDGLNTYVTNNGSNSIGQFSRNTSTGVLTLYTYIGISPYPITIATGSNPYNITISPDGLSVYVPNYNSNTVSEYSRSTSTGLLTSIGTIATGSGANSITISPDGLSAYVTTSNNNSVSEFSRSTSTGLLTSIGTIATGTTPYGITISPDGLFAYVSNYNDNTVSEYSRSTSTGLLTEYQQPVSAVISALGAPSAISISPDGADAYVTTSNNNSVSEFSINTTTGLLALLATTSIGTVGIKPTSIIVSPNGNNVYVTDADSSVITQFLRS